MSPADAWGIDPSYLDSDEQEHRVSSETILYLRGIIGEADSGSTYPIVGRPDELGDLAGVVELEDGQQTRLLADTGGTTLPFGYHWLHTEGLRRRLIVSPGRCFTTPTRGWVLAAQLYGLRSASSCGLGDLSVLAGLGRLARELGADYLLVNPLHGASPALPQQASPYFPATRRFINPIYLSVTAVAGSDLGQDFHAEAERLNQLPLLDRDAVWTAKRAALERIFAGVSSAGAPDGAFVRWRADGAEALEQYALFCVLTDEFGGDWRRWPAEFRRVDSDRVRQYRDEHADRLSFYCWLQWLLAQQLRAAAAGIPIIQDLPIGFDAAGLDGWVWQDLIASDATVGAPPDQFNTAGQDWGLPPFIPWRLRQANYQPFIDSLRSTMLGGGGVRIDHVMGLFRLWWVPGGASAREGAYVRYPAQDLINIVALESYRARSLVVGEDLGTVEAGVREALAEAGILSYRVLWFEEEAPESWPAQAMAAVTTHDLPTVAGLWSGSDLADQQDAGVAADAGSTEQLRVKLARAGALSESATPTDAVQAAYRLLSQAPSALLTLTLEDAAAEPVRPNIPGTIERPNWSFPLPVRLEELASHALLGLVASVLTAATAGGEIDRGDPVPAKGLDAGAQTGVDGRSA